MSPLLAQSGHGPVHRTCLLSGAKRTCPFALHMSAFDPNGHGWPLPAHQFLPLRYLVISRGGNAAARFHRIVGGVAAWPLAVRAQQPAMALVGLLSSAQLDDRQIDAIRQGLKHAGYIEGRNVAVKYRSADSRFDRLPALAADLIADPVTAIIALAPPAAVAAKAATTAIPIVFAIGADPVDLGLVSNFSHPGGNITGVTFVSNTLSAKRLELVRELVPGATIIGLLVNPGNPTSESQIRDAQAAARALDVQLLILKASSERETDAAFESAVQQHVHAVIIGADSLFVSRRDQLVGLAARFAIPAIHFVREFADIGGLASYGPSQTDAYSLAGTYAGRILKGEKPGNLPIQRATKFELVINLKPAKELGLTVPTHLPQIAEVIE
jgi:putative ABC transport system substrate-binding protein